MAIKKSFPKLTLFDSQRTSRHLTNHCCMYLSMYTCRGVSKCMRRPTLRRLSSASAHRSSSSSSSPSSSLPLHPRFFIMPSINFFAGSRPSDSSSAYEYNFFIVVRFLGIASKKSFRFIAIQNLSRITVRFKWWLEVVFLKYEWRSYFSWLMFTA